MNFIITLFFVSNALLFLSLFYNQIVDSSFRVYVLDLNQFSLNCTSRSLSVCYIIITFLELYDSYFTDCLTIILAKAMAPHSSTIAWKIPWMEEPGRLRSMGSLRVYKRVNLDFKVLFYLCLFLFQFCII